MMRNKCSLLIYNKSIGYVCFKFYIHIYVVSKTYINRALITFCIETWKTYIYIYFSEFNTIVIENP